MTTISTGATRRSLRAPATSRLSSLAHMAILPALALVAATFLQATPASADTGTLPKPPKPAPVNPGAPKPPTPTPPPTGGTSVGQNGTSCIGPGCVAVGQNAQCAPGTQNCNINQSAIVNNNNTFQTNISRTLVETNPTTVQVVQAPSPAPVVQQVVQQVAVAVPVEVGISVDRGLGGTYTVGEELGVSFTVNQPMDVTIEAVLKDQRLPLYQGHVEGPTTFNTFVPQAPGVLVLEINGKTSDGHSSKDTTWILALPAK